MSFHVLIPNLPARKLCLGSTLKVMIIVWLIVAIVPLTRP